MKTEVVLRDAITVRMVVTFFKCPITHVALFDPVVMCIVNIPGGVAYVGLQTWNDMSTLTPGGADVSSEGVGSGVPGGGRLIVRDVGIYSEVSMTPFVSFYPDQVSTDIRPPTRADMRGTAAEFVEKGLATDPTVTVTPAPYPVGVLSVVL